MPKKTKTKTTTPTPPPTDLMDPSVLHTTCSEITNGSNSTVHEILDAGQWIKVPSRKHIHFVRYVLLDNGDVTKCTNIMASTPGAKKAAKDQRTCLLKPEYHDSMQHDRSLRKIVSIVSRKWAKANLM
jgi:hypothetical protein